MTKGKLCEYREGTLCQEVYCSGCQIYQEFMHRVERYSEQLRAHKDIYQIPVSLN